MSRQIDFEVIKEDLENAHKLDREEILELAEDLVSHVEYWEKAERSSVKTLTKMLSDAREELEKSQKLIMEQADIFLQTYVSIETRDKEIERLKIKLEAYRENE